MWDFLYISMMNLTKLKIRFTVYCLLFAVYDTFSQINLVQNPSFEIYSSCPDGFGFPNDITKAIPWNNPTGCSPDYFDACNTTNNGFNVPVNFRGYQFARTGTGYAGIDVFEYSTSGGEYIQVKLNDTLVLGKKYLVSFFVSLADSSSYAVNKMGAFLSPNTFFQPGCSKLSYTPQIINSTKILNDKMGWTEVSDTLIAAGGELYITIGNFFSNSQCDTMYFGGGPNNDSYYYIDDVSVIDVADIGVQQYSKNNLHLTFSPNPSTGMIYVSGSDGATHFYKAEVFDISGKLVLKQDLLLENGIGKFKLDVETGAYVLYLNSNENKGTGVYKIMISK